MRNGDGCSRRRGRALIRASVMVLSAAYLTHRGYAASYSWNGNSTGWNNSADWSPGGIPGSGDLAYFNLSGVNSNQVVDLNAAESAAGMVFNSTGSVSLVGGGSNQTLGLGTSGFTLNSGAGNVVIGSGTSGQNVTISLAGSQTWLNNGTGTVSVINGVTLANAGVQTLTLDGSNSGLNTISGALGNGSGTLAVIKNGAGEWVFSGANTYTGGVTINAGTLGITTGPSGGAAPSSPATQITFAGNGALQFQANITSGSALNLNRTYVVGTATTANVSGTVDTQSFTVWANNQWLSTNSGVLTKTGSGTLVFEGADNTNLGMIVTQGAVLMGKTSGSSIGGGGLTINGSTALVQLGDLSQGGPAGDGDQIYYGSGAGVVTVSNGTLDLYGQNATIATLAGSGGTISNGGSGTLSTLTIGDSSNSANSSFGGTIGNGVGTIALVKGGATQLTLSGSNSFTGGLTINAGSVAFSADANLGASGSTVTLSGGTLASTGNVSSLTHVIATGTTGGTISTSAGTSLQLGYFGGNTCSVTGSGSITVSGSQLVLSANDTAYSGNWNVASGILEVQYNGSTSLGSGSVTLASGAELADDYSQNISNAITSNGGTLSFAISSGGTYSGPITLNSGTTTIGLRDFYSTSTARSGTISGLISGTGGLATSGSGVLTLTNPSNSYQGGTTIGAGVLLANSTGSGHSATGSGSVSINSGGTLGGGTPSSPGQISGAVNVNSGGTITAGTGASAASSIGALTTGAETWNSGGVYVAKVSSGAGASNDLLTMSGLTVAATSGSPFTIDLVSQGATSLTTGQQLVIGQIAGAAQGNFSTSDLSLTLTNVTVPAGDTAFLVDMVSGGSDDLIVEAAPEPTGVLLFGIVTAPLLLARRRRARSVNLI